MQMQRSLGLQQQRCYGSETQRERFSVNEETWSSKNDHHNHFQGMRLKNGACDDSHDFSKHHGMFREGHHGSSALHGCVSDGPKLTFGGPSLSSNGSNHYSHHRGHGHGHGYLSEENEYESHKEVRNIAGKVKVDEMRYERHNWGGSDGFCANPHDRNMMNRIHKVEWEVKGV